MKRLKRSLQKLREREGLTVSDAEINSIAVTPEQIAQ
jgi:hypothetical protein